MYYNKEHLGDRPTRMEKAVQLLLKAIETDPNSGAAWYLIGRSVLLVINENKGLKTTIEAISNKVCENYYKGNF